VTSRRQNPRRPCQVPGDLWVPQEGLSAEGPEGACALRQAVQRHLVQTSRPVLADDDPVTFHQGLELTADGRLRQIEALADLADGQLVSLQNHQESIP